MNIQNIQNALIALHTDESGATMTEYIILLILLACAIIGIVATFGKTVYSKFSQANTEVDNSVKISAHGN